MSFCVCMYSSSQQNSPGFAIAADQIANYTFQCKTCHCRHVRYLLTFMLNQIIVLAVGWLLANYKLFAYHLTKERCINPSGFQVVGIFQKCILGCRIQGPHIEIANPKVCLF